MKIIGGVVVAIGVLLYIMVAASARPLKNRSIETSSSSVKLVVVITRHGDRTPIFSFKPENLEPVTWNCELPATIEAVPIQIFDVASPPYPRLYRKIYKKDIESFAGNCAAGQLTVTGMKQHYALGQRLRNKYNTLLGDVKLEFGSKQVYVESTDIPRTFLSAQSQLLGVFPPKTSTSLDTAEIIPIETTELSVSDFYPNYATCPKLSVIRGDVVKSQVVKDFYNKILPFKNDLAKKLKFMNGSSVGFPEWTQIYDTFACRRAHEYPLPEPFTIKLVDEIISIAETEWMFLLNNTDYTHLGIGSFFSRIKEKLSNAVNGVDKDLKYALFSGHDTTLGPLLSLLGVFDGFWPPYAANLVFELSQDDTEWSIRLFYNDKELYLPGCPSKQPCPWKVFDQITKRKELSKKEYKTLCVV